MAPIHSKFPVHFMVPVHVVVPAPIHFLTPLHFVTPVDHVAPVRFVDPVYFVAPFALAILFRICAFNILRKQFSFLFIHNDPQYPYPPLFFPIYFCTIFLLPVVLFLFTLQGMFL